MLLDADECQLVLVDYQVGLMPVVFEHELVVANAVRLAKIAKVFSVPIWATVQSPDKLGQSMLQVQAAIEAAQGRALTKMHFSAAAEGLADCLRPTRQASGGNARSLPKHLQKTVPPAEEGRNTIVIAGCEAHICMLQTALELLEDEFEVWVVTDACSSRSERNRDAAFDRLAGNGAELVTTEMVAFEWLRTAAHESFRDIQALIK